MARRAPSRGYLFPRGHIPTLADIRATCAIEPETECWIWQHTTNTRGYGTFQNAGRGWRAHRYTWTLVNGEILNDLTVDHLCFRPACVNPAHMRLLTAVENSALNTRALQTHCKRGHEFTPENTTAWTRANGSTQRQCRTCHLNYLRARKAAA